MVKLTVTKKFGCSDYTKRHVLYNWDTQKLDGQKHFNISSFKNNVKKTQPENLDILNKLNDSSNLRGLLRPKKGPNIYFSMNLFAEKIPSFAKMIYGKICNLADSLKNCVISNGTLAKLFHCEKNYVSKNLSLLKRLGYIKIHLTYDEDGKTVIKRKIEVIEEKKRELAAQEKNKKPLIIFEKMLEDKRLSKNDIRVYGLVYGLSEKDGYCWSTNRNVGEDLGLSKSTISRILRKLFALGYVDKKNLYKGDTKEFDVRIIKPNLTFTESRIGEKTILENIREVVDKERKKRFLKKLVNNIYAEEFSQIWEKFPKKKGRKEAFKAYVNARIKGETFEKIRDGVDLYVAYLRMKNVEEKYICGGANWFKKKRWNANLGVMKADEDTKESGSGYDIDEYLTYMDTFAEDEDKPYETRDTRYRPSSIEEDFLKYKDEFDENFLGGLSKEKAEEIKMFEEKMGMEKPLQKKEKGKEKEIELDDLDDEAIEKLTQGLDDLVKKFDVRLE